MRMTLLFLGIVAFIMACGGNDSTAAAAVDGEKIYKTHCLTCHGLYGDMGASGAFNLQQSQLTLEERIQVITNGRNAMTPFKTLLDEKKIKAVAEYTFTLKKD